MRLIFKIGIMSNSNIIVRSRMPQNPFSKKSALAQVMIVAIKFYINKKRQAYVYLK